MSYAKVLFVNASLPLTAAEVTSCATRTKISPTKVRESRKQFELSLCFSHQSRCTAGDAELNGVSCQDILLTKDTIYKHLTYACTLEKTNLQVQKALEFDYTVILKSEWRASGEEKRNSPSVSIALRVR